MVGVRYSSGHRLHPCRLRHRVFGVGVCSRLVADWISPTPARQSTRDSSWPDTDSCPNCIHLFPGDPCFKPLAMAHVVKAVANASAHNTREQPAHIYHRAHRNGSGFHRCQHPPFPPSRYVCGLLLSIRTALHAISRRRFRWWRRFCLGRTHSGCCLRRGRCSALWSHLGTVRKAKNKLIVGDKCPLCSKLK